MGNKLTTDKFIEKAKSIHGDRYGYDLVEYKGSHIKIKIVCQDHGEFEQLATNHISGYGCPDKSHKSSKSTKTFTTDEIVDRARKIHKEYYDYSLLHYINMGTKVKIICPLHGLFEQKAGHHIQGSNCPHKDHKIFNILPLEVFQTRGKLIHQDKYDYSLVEYRSVVEKVNIICKIHGPFAQSGADHLSGHGCQKCGDVYRKSTEDFIKEAQTVHGDRYDYSLANYISNRCDIKIICKIHGLFEQRSSEHLYGSGCNKCGIEDKTYSIEDFILKAQARHGFRYDYSQSQYINCRTHISIKCKQHGPFLQIASMHIFGSGCPSCGHAVSKGEILWLNSLNVPNEQRQLSIKIDNKTYKTDAYDSMSKTIYEFYGDYWHGNPKVFDQKLLHPLKQISYKELYDRTIDKEILYKKNGYNVISIWEYDWKLFCASLKS